MATSRNVERDRAIGARICLARIRLGMSRPALCGRLGISSPRIARFERGSAGIPASMLEDLGAALEREPTFFLAAGPEAADAVATALAEVETVLLPERGTVARRHLDQVLAVLGGTVPPGGVTPFGSAAPAARQGSAAA